MTIIFLYIYHITSIISPLLSYCVSYFTFLQRYLVSAAYEGQGHIPVERCNERMHCPPALLVWSSDLHLLVHIGTCGTPATRTTRWIIKRKTITSGKRREKNDSNVGKRTNFTIQAQIDTICLLSVCVCVCVCVCVRMHTRNFKINDEALKYFFLLKYSSCPTLYKLQVYNIVIHNFKGYTPFIVIIKYWPHFLCCTIYPCSLFYT